MLKKFLLSFTLSLFAGSVITGQSTRLIGTIFDNDSLQPLNGALIILHPDNFITSSDSKGEFVFQCSPGKKTISSRIIGYKRTELSIVVRNDTAINLFVKKDPYELKEVVIKGESTKTPVITHNGSIIITPSSQLEPPRLLSEPDLIKSFQMLPGVVAGKDGSSDMYVRGGGAGQNIATANGCYFFLPSHLLGVISAFDLDFLKSAELFKDYIPANMGGGASSVISLDFKEPHSDSISTSLRLGLLSSGLTLEMPFKKAGLELTAGFKRGNYFVYAPILKKIVSHDVGDFLPPQDYSFSDGFFRISHDSHKWGKLTYLFFGNYDNGNENYNYTSQNGDTLIKYMNEIASGWRNTVHSLEWNLRSKRSFNWKIDLNFNELTINRKIITGTDEFLRGNELISHEATTYSFSPSLKNLNAAVTMGKEGDRFNYSVGISNTLRWFMPANYASRTVNELEVRSEYSSHDKNNESAVFFSSEYHPVDKMIIKAGLRVTHITLEDANFTCLEPRVRLSYNENSVISYHINYVRLSQNIHTVEGSNTGLRTMLWIPLSKEFGPEISDIFSAGFNSRLGNGIFWTIDGYYKYINRMLDLKSGASFVYDTAFVDLLDKVRGKAYGIEACIIKSTGRVTGMLSYTYSRSKREWYTPEGITWIPTGADRPHNVNLSMKYHLSDKTSLGLNWVFQSGLPATVYTHETTYGEWLEHKNNIRYYPYHRLDISLRQTLIKRRILVFIEADIYNVYNRKNTFYLKKTYDEVEKIYYYKNISMFPIMPTLTVSIKY